MFRMFRPRGLVTALGGLLIFMTAAVMIAKASSTLNVRDPERPRTAGEAPPLAAPMLRPPPSVAYTPHTPGQPITHPDGRPVAQLSTVPADVQDTAVFLSTQRTPSAGEISFAILSSIRYSGNGRLLYVSTIRPSEGAARHALGLGNETVRLADGSTAWVTTDLAGDAPNRVATVRDGLIVAIEGDLPVDTLKALLTTVVIRR